MKIYMCFVVVAVALWHKKGLRKRNRSICYFVSCKEYLGRDPVFCFSANRSMAVIYGASAFFVCFVVVVCV